MSRTTTVRKYGKTTRKQTAEVLFAQLPRTPVKAVPEPEPEPGPACKPEMEIKVSLADEISEIAVQLESIALNNTPIPEKSETRIADHTASLETSILARSESTQIELLEDVDQRNHHGSDEQEPEEESSYDDLRVLSWADVCAAGDRIEKIAEASYAEVYRITNAHGTSIIKAVRLESPIKAQTKAQERSGLVDEEPHSEVDMEGELRISEWLADIPGFVVYKERYVVKGKAPKTLLETHQVFHRRMKRKDPDRLQFYPSPSRYLDDTRFLVVELGDAGTALEDFKLTSISEVWDIFLHTALALARAEDLVEFEHRDLHEGNLCIRRVRPPTAKPAPASGGTSSIQFGFSGLDITILDYGLSRATDPDSETPRVVAYDLEKDLSLFQSTHAPQCGVYRQMRSFLIHQDRVHLPPSEHTTPYPLCRATATTANGEQQQAQAETISWQSHTPYTNTLWLAYLYAFLVKHFQGDKRELAHFKRETKELRMHLDPEAPRGVLSFPCAAEVVRFAVEAGWVGEGQIVEGSFLSQCQGDEDKEEGSG